MVVLHYKIGLLIAVERGLEQQYNRPTSYYVPQLSHS